MQNGAWTACCEDVPIDNSRDNYNAVEPCAPEARAFAIFVSTKKCAPVLQFVIKRNAVSVQRVLRRSIGDYALVFVNCPIGTLF